LAEEVDLSFVVVDQKCDDVVRADQALQLGAFVGRQRDDVEVVVEDTITDETYLIDGDTLLEGGNGLYTNLHVYFS
jgi:hypothetical protein